jgi:hypothetical protein
LKNALDWQKNFTISIMLLISGEALSNHYGFIAVSIKKDGAII